MQRRKPVRITLQTTIHIDANNEALCMSYYCRHLHISDYETAECSLFGVELARRAIEGEEDVVERCEQCRRASKHEEA